MPCWVNAKRQKRYLNNIKEYQFLDLNFQDTNVIKRRLALEDDIRGMSEKEKVVFSPEKEGKKELIFDQKETILKSAEIDGEPRRVQGSNEVFYIKLASPEVAGAIFKPASGEVDFPELGYWYGDYYKRERAAYLVDRFFSFNLIPPTVIREISGEIGSLQEYIPIHRAGWQIESLSDLVAINEQDFTKMAVLDFIIWNTGRSLPNIFIVDQNKQERLICIDNSLSFRKGTVLRAEGTDKLLSLKEIPEEIINNIEKAFSNRENLEILRNMLNELLKSEEIDNFFDRIERVMYKKRITDEDIADFSY